MSHVIVNFHGLGPHRPGMLPKDGEVWVQDVDLFAAMLDVVKDQPAARLTFDDGNASDVDVALPMLRDRGLTAEFFVLPGKLGQPGFLEAEQVRELRRQGMSVGTHGMHHVPWRGLSAEQAHEELVAARELVEELVHLPVRSAACPFGAYDRVALRRLRAAGYDRVLTSDGGWAGDRWLQPRRSVRADDDLGSFRSFVVRPPARRERAVLAAKRLAKRWR